MNVSPRIQEVLDRLERTRTHYYNLARPAAELLFILARLARPVHVVEVGTANGYSAIVLGAAVQSFGGRVSTIERNGRLVDEARGNLIAAGLQDVVTVFPGSAYKVLKRLEGPFHALFLDGAKQEYHGYFERARPKLAPHALLVADNMLSHEAELASFSRMIAEDPHVSSLVFPVGLGLLIAAYEGERSGSSDHPMPSMKELMASALPRVFRGTAQEVRNGAIFRDVASGEERAMNGYDIALAEEAERLPEEEDKHA